MPVLLGLDDEENPSVFVAVDGTNRLGNANRFSLLFHRDIIAEAKAKGWAVYESSSGEKIYAFVPELFPAFIEQIKGGEMLDVDEISSALVASGVSSDLEDDHIDEQSAERATRAVNILVRKAGTGRKIRNAYGNRCAMCGLGMNLLAGAHVYPVEAPGSTDEVWNGLSLCLNHHGAFDQHLIWIDPVSKAIRMHPDLLNEAQANDGTRHFVESTLPVLANTLNPAHRPRQAMFERRYDYYPGKYDWVED